jgi:hypothetical protein
VRRWAAHARAADTGALEPVMPRTTSRRGPAAAPEQEPEPRPLFELTPEQEHDLIALALATLQESQPTWRKADLIRHLGELIPDDTVCRDDETAATLLEQLADRMLAGGAGAQHVPAARRDQVRHREPAQPRRPAHRARAPNLRSPPGARASGAVPRRGTGAAAQRNLAPTRTRTRRSRSPAWACGWTRPLPRSPCAPATAAPRSWSARPARARHIRPRPLPCWQQAEIGEVCGLALSQAARNVLHEAGVTTAGNIAKFLGHLKGRREVLGAKPISPRTLLILDEASTTPIADLAAILPLAAEHDCKVLITGDHEQLAAVEGGGAMTMLARRLGYTQLASSITVTLADAHQTRRR